MRDVGFAAPSKLAVMPSLGKRRRPNNLRLGKDGVGGTVHTAEHRGMFFGGRRLIGEDALFPHALPQLRDEENAGGGDEGGGCEDNWDVEMDADRGVLVQAGEDVGVGVNAVLVGVDVAHDVRDGFGGGGGGVGGGGGAVKEVAEDARGRAGVATGRGRGTTTALGGGASCRACASRASRGESHPLACGQRVSLAHAAHRARRHPSTLDERARTRIIALLVSTVLARTKIPPREGFEDARAPPRASLDSPRTRDDQEGPRSSPHAPPDAPARLAGCAPRLEICEKGLALYRPRYSTARLPGHLVPSLPSKNRVRVSSLAEGFLFRG